MKKIESENQKFISNEDLLKNYKNNKDLIFVSGCFDILHFGHINFLKKAKELGNGKLLVMTHDDESIKLKKGNQRPVNSVYDRIGVLSELQSVDLVSVWNGWEDLQDFVKLLKPGMIALTKGEFNHKSVEKVAMQIGAKLLIIDKLDGLSTSQIIQKIKD